jgi:hypothetical protein
MVHLLEQFQFSEDLCLLIGPQTLLLDDLNSAFLFGFGADCSIDAAK